MSSKAVPLLLSFLLLTTLPAHAELDVELNGNAAVRSRVQPIDEVETFRFSAPRDAEITLALKAARQGVTAWTVRLFGPDGQEIDLAGFDGRKDRGAKFTLKKFPAPATGRYRLTIRGNGVGDYRMALKVKARKKLTGDFPFLGGDEATFEVPAPTGATLGFTAKTLKGPAVEPQFGPLTGDGVDLDLTAMGKLSTKKHVVKKVGPTPLLADLTVTLRSLVAPMAQPGNARITVKVKAPKIPKQKEDFRAQIGVLPDIDTAGSPNGIVALPDTVDPRLRTVFVSYTKLVAPGGGPIHILAQGGVSDAQVIHARSILSGYLTDVPGTQHGNDKTPVADRLSDSGAALLLFDDEAAAGSLAAEALFRAGFRARDLNGDEIVLPGSVAYMGSTARDASYEEIVHFVQDFGLASAVPVFQADLETATAAAVAAGRYVPLPDLDLDDFDNEYLALGLEIYYGLWAHDPGGDGFAGNGELPFIDRAGLAAGDTTLFALIETFFSPTHDYVQDLDSALGDPFELTRNPAQNYTHRSQYLTQVRATGSAAADLLGNDGVNQLLGNDGPNELTGGAGDDFIDGGGNVDTAVFTGDRDEYVITPGAAITVQDTTALRDGTDTLLAVEFLRFADVTVSTQ